MNREEIKTNINKMYSKHNKTSVTKLINGKKQPIIKESIIKETSYLPDKSKMGERIYHIVNDIYKRPICKQCDKYLKFSGGYRTYCGRKCSRNNPDVIDRYKQAMLDKYGCDNPVHSKELQEKTKQTCLNKYGCEYPSQSKEVQEKTKQTCLNKYDGILYSIENVEKRKKEVIKNIKKFLKNINIEMVGDYNKCQKSITFKCLKCKKEFESTWFNIQQGKRCPYCSTKYFTSKEENDIYNYLKYILHNDVEIIQNERQVIRNSESNRSLELDIYIPEKNIAIEFNGLYWHSSIIKDKNYHLLKTNLCKEKGIHLIHIFEDEWLYKRDIVKLKLKQLLNVSDNEIDLTQCKIKAINSRIKNKFLVKYSIYGKDDSSIKFGIFYKTELIYVMTFLELHDNTFILNRSCSKYNIIGMENRVLKYFKRNYNWKEICSYIDLRWSDGKLNKCLGFIMEHQIEPMCWYFNRSTLKRINVEKENYLKIYDCGKAKYKLINTSYNTTKE